jgi:uncharacterized membrane protein
MAIRTQDTTGVRENGRSQHDETTTLGDRVRRGASGALGLALLVRGLRRRSPRGVAMALAGGWLLSRTLPKRYRTRDEDESGVGGGDSTGVSRSVTIGKSADDLYEAWRDPTVFSAVMGHFAEVTPSTEDRFHWAVKAPFGQVATWETRVAEAEPGEVVRWETPADPMLSNAGEVRFRDATGDRGTEVTLTLAFDPPGGALGDAALRRLDLAPRELAGVALSRFKSLVESGSIPTLDGNPSARGRGDRL